MKTQSLDIVYNPEAINWLTDFFTKPLHQTTNTNLRAAARKKYQAIKAATKNELIKNPDTFLLEIEESLLPQYNSWLGILDDQIETEKLTKQLVASPGISYFFFLINLKAKKFLLIKHLNECSLIKMPVSFRD